MRGGEANRERGRGRRNQKAKEASQFFLLALRRGSAFFSPFFFGPNLSLVLPATETTDRQPPRGPPHHHARAGRQDLRPQLRHRRRRRHLRAAAARAAGQRPGHGGCSIRLRVPGLRHAHLQQRRVRAGDVRQRDPVPRAVRRRRRREEKREEFDLFFGLSLKC